MEHAAMPMDYEPTTAFDGLQEMEAPNEIVEAQEEQTRKLYELLMERTGDYLHAEAYDAAYVQLTAVVGLIRATRVSWLRHVEVAILAADLESVTLDATRRTLWTALMDELWALAYD